MIYRQTKGSAGADLSASEDVVIPAGKIVLVPTGYYLEDKAKFKPIFEDFFYLLTARSSLAYKKGLLLGNGVGVIDSDYPDEVKVMLYNPSSEDVTISKGERIAQLIPMNYLSLFPSLDEERVSGFGSTGEK
jgi:dUTP pyrophosphatase